MVRYLRSDVTPLSEDDIQDIINARYSMKRASQIMAKKYKISSRRVYQIWRCLQAPVDTTTSGLQSTKTTNTLHGTIKMKKRLKSDTSKM